MIQYQKLLHGAPVGVPGVLPAELVGLAVESLTDLSWADAALGYKGQGFVAVELPDPTPPGPRTCSVYEFLYGRMTQAERILLRSSTDPIVQDFHEALNMVPRVELDADFTVAALGYLESKTYIAAGRAAAILA